MLISLRVAGVALLATWLASCSNMGIIDITGLTSYRDPSGYSGPRLPGRVYILRGIGHIWSKGMTELADELNRRGTTASAHRHSEWYEIADDAIRLYKSNPDQWPIVLIGHSNGGDQSINIAYRLKEKGVPVALIVGYDPTRFTRQVPSNVGRFINLYQATNLLGGGRVEAARDFRGQLINVDLRNHYNLGHMNIDRSPHLKEEVIAKVLQVVAFPQPTATEMVSIRYVVPAGERIELWDGGLPVTLAPGETVDQLGQIYGVPSWAIRQASGIDDGAPVRVGQRLIIPRHINTLAPPGLSPLFAGQYPAYGQDFDPRNTYTPR